MARNLSGCGLRLQSVSRQRSRSFPPSAVITSLKQSQFGGESLQATDQPRLLLADDDQMTRRIAAKILTKAGYAVRCVGAGTEVLEQLDKHDFSVVLLDIDMPDMTGIEVYEALQAKAVNLPVIFVSGNPDQLTAEHSDLAVVAKPFRSAQLVETVDRKNNLRFPRLT